MLLPLHSTILSSLSTALSLNKYNYQQAVDHFLDYCKPF